MTEANHHYQKYQLRQKQADMTHDLWLSTKEVAVTGKYALGAIALIDTVVTLNNPSLTGSAIASAAYLGTYGAHRLHSHASRREAETKVVSEHEFDRFLDGSYLEDES